MKRVVVVVSALVVVMVCVLALTLAVNQYSLSAEVVERREEVVTFEDSTGNLWEYEDTEGEYQVGDKVKLTWNDKGTKMKQDDVIIKVVAQ